MTFDYAEYGKAISVEVKGLKEAQQKLEQTVRDLQGEPMLNAMRKATMVVQSEAKKKAPVNTGRLRASIVPEIRTVGTEIQGVVGSNVTYAAAVHNGSRPHWAPLEPLIRWVHLKRLSGIYSTKTKRRLGNKATQEEEDKAAAVMIRYKIAARGTKAQPFLLNAFNENKERIAQYIDGGVAEVITKDWGK